MRPRLISSDGNIIEQETEALFQKDSKIRFPCSGCGKTLKVRSEFVGKKGKCPACGQPVVVPEKSDVPILDMEMISRNRSNSQKSGSNSRFPVNSQWDSQIWQYYKDYVLNVMPKSPLGIEFRYVGLGWRAFQFLLDVIPLAIVFYLIIGPFLKGLGSQASTLGVELAIGGLFIAIAIGYWSFMEASTFQGTLGKMILDLKVINDDGQPLSFKEALIRNIVKGILLVPPLCLLHLSIGLGKKKQGIHDRIAKTFVIVNPKPVYNWQTERRWLVLWFVAILLFLGYLLGLA